MTIQDIINNAKTTFTSSWSIRDGRKVPDTADIKLANDALKLDATVLYADLCDSTALVDSYKPEFAAEVYKTYLMGTCRVIRNNGGEITAFDGDRVMAVFIGDQKNTSAAKSALQIHAYVRALNDGLKAAYPKTSYTIKQSVGVDASELLVARTGIRNNNDLVWVGKAANYAAKLCELADASYPSYISETVFAKLSDTAKYGGNPRASMWEKRIWSERGLVVYRSNWNWKF